MLISKDDLGEMFDRIHKVWIQTKTAVIILCAADCDSICTTNILTSLLQTEMIGYKIQPVLSYEHIASYNDNTLQERIRENELHTIIMINCGAIVDLHQMLFVRPLIQQFYSDKQHQSQLQSQRRRQNNNDDDDMSQDDDDFDLDEEDIEQQQEDENAKLDEYVESNLPQDINNFKIYVIDSHRPFNLDNVYDHDKIFLLQGDDEQKLDDFPKLIDEEEDEDGDEDEDNEQDDDDDFNVDDIEDDIDDDDDDDDDLKDDNETNEPLKKKRKLNNNNSNDGLSDRQRRLIRARRAQDEYYKYQYYGLNSSGIMYLMARSVQKDDNGMLWSAILGLTESFIYEKIDRDKYNECVSYYCDEVKRRNETYNNISTMDDEVRYNLGDENVENSQIVSHRTSDHIQFSTEFRFTLMRFWTLYDSMYYSRYVATNLGIWKQRGKDNLKFMFAKMALPLSEAQEPYCSMKRLYKKKLPQLFAENSDQGFDDNLTYGSFTKQHGGHQSISASDMVYAITAVLESDFKVKSNDIQHDIQTDNSNNDENENENEKENKQTENEDNLALFFNDNAWKSNFFYGYDVLNKEHQYLLRNAINLAKERQREIIDMGIRLIEKKDIKPIGIMRYCKIENSNNFQSPMLLCKLALFIMDAYRAQTTKNAKHFVLASYNDKSNSYTVVGIPAKRYIGDVNKSPFYNSFEEARKRVNANAKIVFFEGHVIQIHKDHFTEWLENLHERLLSYAF